MLNILLIFQNIKVCLSLKHFFQIEMKFWHHKLINIPIQQHRLKR